MSEELKHKLFTSTECISEKTMFEYIDNKLSAREQHLVERHMLHCELCSDAMEGLQLLKNRDRIYQLNKAVLEKISKPEAKIFSINRRVIISVAAGLLLLLGGVFFFNMFMGGAMKEDAMAELKEAPKDMDITSESSAAAADSAVSPTSITEEKNQEAAAEASRSDEKPLEKIADLEEEHKQVLQEVVIKYEDNFNTAEGAADELKSEKAPQAPGPDVDTKANQGFAGTTTTVNESYNITLNKSKGKDDDLDKEKDQYKTNGATGTRSAESNDKSGGKREEEQVLAFGKKTQKEDKKKTESSKEENAPQKSAGNAAPITNGDLAQNQNNINTIAMESTIANVADSISTSGYMDANLAGFETAVDESAEFPGGTGEMAKFIGKNVNWHLVNPQDGTHSTIYIQFIVDTNGSIKNPKVIKGINPAYDAEALRVVKLMPKWKPAKKGGKVVNQQINLPFRLELK